MSDWKQIVAYILCGLMGTTGGGLGSLYVQGKKDQQIENRLTSLEKGKVSEKKFEQMEGLLISIAVDICKLKSNSHTKESDCEAIRYNYYNSH